MPSATPSVDPDAPTPKTLQDEDSAKPQVAKTASVGSP